MGRQDVARRQRQSRQERWRRPFFVAWCALLLLGAVVAAPVFREATSAAGTIQAQTVTTRDGSDGIVVLIPTPEGAHNYAQRLQVNRVLLALRAVPGVVSLTSAYDGDRRYGMIAHDELSTVVLVNLEPGLSVTDVTATVQQQTDRFPGVRIAGASVDRLEAMRALDQARPVVILAGAALVLLVVALLLGRRICVTAAAGGLSGAVLSLAFTGAVHSLWPGTEYHVTGSAALTAGVAAVVGMVMGGWTGLVSSSLVENEALRTDPARSPRFRAYFRSIPTLYAIAAVWALAGSVSAVASPRTEVTEVSIGQLVGLATSLLVVLPLTTAFTPLPPDGTVTARAVRRHAARTDGRGAPGYRWAVRVGNRPWLSFLVGAALFGGALLTPRLFGPFGPAHVHGGEVADFLLGHYSGLASGVAAALTHTSAVRSAPTSLLVPALALVVVLTFLVSARLTRSYPGSLFALVCAALSALAAARVAAWFQNFNDSTSFAGALMEERLSLALAAGVAWCMTMVRSWQLLLAAHVASLEGNDARRAQVLGMARSRAEGTSLAVLNFATAGTLLAFSGKGSITCGAAALTASVLAEVTARLILPAALVCAGELVWALPGAGAPGRGRGAHERLGKPASHRVRTLDLFAEGDRERRALRARVRSLSRPART